ncbi:hypothetical protein AX16_005689 [Volvariella volvacea WC 439]|nr:hypothetical protein AX16_005689 [Volvariella volvacea WC 439]
MTTKTGSQAYSPLLSPSVDYPPLDSGKIQPRSMRARSRRRNALFQPRVYMPILVILWQSAILAWGWGFYAVTRRRAIPLPDNLAVTVQERPRTVTFIITLIATLISINTGFFYSQAIRYSVAMSLSRPISLFSLSSSLKLAAKGPVLSIRHWKWSLVALVCVVALSAQTAGWTTLLTPRPIARETELSGFGVDMGNSEFITQVIVDTDNSTLAPDLWMSNGPIIEDSGVSAVAAAYNQSATFNFNGMTFYRSTGGILFANLQTVPTQSGRRIEAKLPANAAIASSVRSPPGFPMNYTVTQQGFTADVHCEQRDLNEDTSPSLRWRIEPQTVGGRDLFIADAEIGCGGGNASTTRHIMGPVRDAEGDMVPNAIFPGVCVYNNHTNYEIILVGRGNYDWIPPTICTISPKVTRVDVQYSQSPRSSSEYPDFIEVLEPWEATDMPGAGHASAYMVWRTLVFGQTLAGNTIGDSLVSFYLSETSKEQDRNQVLNFILEAWLRGVFEFGATLVRTAYTENTNNFFGNPGTPIPERFRSPVNGTFTTETIGWHHQDSDMPVVLLAPTFITSLSILIVFYTLFRYSKDTRVEGQDHFDLNNPLHIIAAAAVGNFKEPFPPFDADLSQESRHSTRVRVRLGLTEAGELGLVQHNVV